jgi:uncharacterized pyridoxal phosphate-containing UPF0001 family protein
MVHSVDSLKLAQSLNKHASKLRKQPLKILVQLNTSGEESKGGIEPKDCINVVAEILKNCPALEFCGLMTIGLPDAPPDQPDFKVSCFPPSNISSAWFNPKKKLLKA